LDKDGRFIPQEVDVLTVLGSSDAAEQASQSFHSSVKHMILILKVNDLLHRTRAGIEKRNGHDKQKLSEWLGEWQGIKDDIRFKHIGAFEGLSVSLKNCISNAQRLTENNKKLCVQLAFNYGSRLEIVEAVKKIAREVKEGMIQPEDITEKRISDNLYTSPAPDPDLLIRTSGEMRISNFLLWQLCYTELYITKKMWPEFNKRELIHALKEYQKRNRRFGGIHD
jgi:undecaprenyl diphosphate synthase